MAECMVNWLLIALISWLSSQSSHYLITRSWSVVRATSLVSLIFICLFYFLPFEVARILSIAAFGGSLLGGTEPGKFTFKQMTVASFLYSLLFVSLIPWMKDFGGALGFTAFISCILTHYLKLFKQKSKGIKMKWVSKDHWS